MENGTFERELTLADIFYIFKKRIWWFLLTLIIVVALSVVYLYLATPIYEAKVTMKIEPSSQTGIADIFSNTYGYSGRPDISTEIELIKSKRNIEEVIKRLKLIDRLRESNPKINFDNAIKTVSNWISVNSVKDTKIVSIAVQNSDPKLAADIANELARVYNELLMILSKNQYTAKRKFIEEQIPKLEKDLKEAEEKIRKFREEHNFFILDEEAKWLLQFLSEYDEKLNSVNIQIEEAKANIKVLNEFLSKESEKIVTSETVSYNPVVINLRQKLADLYVQLSALELQYSENSPKVMSVKKQIAEIKELLKKEVEKVVTSEIKSINPTYSNLISQLIAEQAQLQVLEASRDSIEKIRNNYYKRVSQLPWLDQQFMEMQRNLKVKENLYTLLLEKLEETKIAEAGVTGNAQIIDYAKVPTTPVKPNKKLVIAISGALGFFLGILIVFMVEAIDDTIRDEEEVKRIIGDVPIIGRISEFERKPEESEIVTVSHPTAPISESIKLLAMNVMFSLGGKNKVICVTSPGPSEGKTFTTANLATVLAQNGYKTLILDLDMRKPRVEKVFGIQRMKIGITSHIFKGVPLDEITINVGGNLYIIPVGVIPPNPTVILTSPKLKEILFTLKQKYDVVIVDLPPILAAADALIVGKNTDGMLIVTRANSTQRSSLKIAYENLKTAGVNIIGAVINGITKQYGSYYYYYYYYYYSEDGTKHKKKKRRKKKKETHESK